MKVGAFLALFAAQFSAMGLSIFHFSTWDVVEPLTWVVQSTWIFTGATFFLWQKSDMNERMMFPDFKDKKYDQLIKSHNFDTEKEQFLTTLIDEVEHYNNKFGMKNYDLTHTSSSESEEESENN